MNRPGIPVDEREAKVLSESSIGDYGLKGMNATAVKELVDKFFDRIDIEAVHDNIKK